MGPRARQIALAQAERLLLRFGLDGHRVQQFGDLREIHAAIECHGTDMVAVHAARQVAQHRVLGIGCDPLDHELLTGDTQ